jgi:hypothetical protein
MVLTISWAKSNAQTFNLACRIGEFIRFVQELAQLHVPLRPQVGPWYPSGRPRISLERYRPLTPMNYLFLLVPLALSAPAIATERPLHGLPATRHYESSRETFSGPDRTITWRAWKEAPGGEFRVRTGDRYLGHGRWEHYLGFEEHHSSSKEIKISMIHLARATVPDVRIRPGSRYAIVKVTNSTMTGRKGRWSWTAQEVHARASSHTLVDILSSSSSRPQVSAAG